MAGVLGDRAPEKLPSLLPWVKMEKSEVPSAPSGSEGSQTINY